MKTDSTESCRIKAAELCPGTFVGDWKRTWKVNTDGGAVRHLYNKKTGQQVVVVYYKDDDYLAAHLCDENSSPGLTMFSTDAQALLAACKDIKHCGDYCHLYWNPNTRVAHLTMATGMEVPKEASRASMKSRNC